MGRAYSYHVPRKIMTTIASNLQAVRDAIAQAAQHAKRDAADIKLLAVSKTFSPDLLREAYDAGQRCFGESYVQEALAKIVALGDLSIEWHYIGPIQSNKTRPIAESFTWVHSVDRVRIAERLSEQRPADLPPLQVCIQVNVSGEKTKHGITPDEASGLAHAISGLPRMQLRGLMAVPAPCRDVTKQRLPFAKLHALLGQLNHEGLQLDTLSMGMSDDFAAAIAEGATIVRIGSAIFGLRNTKKEAI